jgi:hypothetical protein
VFGRILGSLLTIGTVSASFVQQATVPFDVCAQSVDWKRLSADVQSKIWNDPRYRQPGPAAYQWTHNFLPSEPDSASISYENANLSGLWTEAKESQCPRRDGERNAWTEIWALNYLVTGISVSGRVYRVAVVAQERGYEIIQFRRPDSLGPAKASLRFVTDDGRILAEWVEVSPSVFAPVTHREAASDADDRGLDHVRDPVEKKTVAIGG